jgi:hypothetical protein
MRLVLLVSEETMLARWNATEVYPSALARIDPLLLARSDPL